MPAIPDTDLPESIEHLARSVAPIIRFDDNEPFLPSVVGVSLLTEPGQAVAAPQWIDFEPGVAKVVEFAIWWDWDIQHLYELEHVWVKLGADDTIVGVTASAHGGQFPMHRPDGSLPIDGGRVTVYAEPGKHAFHVDKEMKRADRKMLRFACSGTTLPGVSRGHILESDAVRDVLPVFSPEDNRRARRWLQRQAFVPSFKFSKSFDIAELPFCSWPTLKAYIGQRVPEVAMQLQSSEPLIKAVLIDSGDTLVDEGSEVWSDGVVTRADLLPGAREMLDALSEEGYRMCLVADGRVLSFDNVHGAHDISRHFEARVISETLGCEKPDARMFNAALDAMHLKPADANACVMIGNNLERDIAGAKALGIRTIWIDWSPRRPKLAANPDEVPDYVVRQLSEIPHLLERIEHDMFNARRRQDVARNLGG